MADTEALESVAALLPPERRERFFDIASKFEAVREDDDHLMMLEAIGFMTLTMKEIPSEIAKLLDSSQRKIGHDDTEQLREEIVEVLKESMDTPSYKDLRETIRSIKDQEARLRQQADKMHRSLGETVRHFKGWQRPGAAIIAGVVSALSVMAAVAGAAYFFLPGIQEPKQPQESPEIATLPKKLQPYAKLLERDALDFFEADLPDFGGKVDLYILGNNVMTAFRDGPSAVVVCKPVD